MKSSATTSRFRQDRKEVEALASPFKRPSVYWISSSSSSSSSFDDEMETVPMIPDVETQSSNSAASASGCKTNRRKARSMKIYLPFVAFVVLACLSYYSQEAKNSFSIQADVETKLEDTEEGEDTTVLETTAPTLNPTQRQTESELALTAMPSRKPSQKPSVKPTSEATEKVVIVEKDTAKEVEVKTKKRNLVIHIGPQKTGSTTLQGAWHAPLGVLSNSLKADNYLYDQIHLKSGYFNCDFNTNNGGYSNCEASQKLKNFIRTAKNEDKNLLLSDENLDDRFPETLRNVIDENDWDVTVIVVYRRIHMWLHSWYDQINKTTNKDAKGNFLRDKDGHTYRTEHTLWPDEGGSQIPTFSSWYKTFTRYFDREDLASEHRSIAFMNAYKPFFKNIVVHNMHQDGDLITNFMCNSVPNAPRSCDLLKNRQWRLPRNNQSVDLNYDIIAVEARERDILKTSFKRKYVASRIEKFVTENGKKIPCVCDQEMADEIEQWLFDSEKAMFPDTWSEQQELEVRQSFDGYFNSGKLCDVDFERVFADEEWLEFFQSLDNRPHLILHIGPQKTGSTTLQRAWNHKERLGDVMAEDNFYYYSLWPSKGMFDCDYNEAELENCNASDMMREVLANASEEGTNLLLSDENMNDRFVGALREVISDKQFRVKVVLVYRRIHQWLPSWYSQTQKTAVRDSDGNVLRNEDGLPRRRPHTKWPSEGGVHVPNFTDWYRGFVEELPSSDLVANHRTILYKNTFEPYFDNIAVYDMNQEGDFVTNFMCQMIPQASKTCQRLQQGDVNIPLANPSVNVEHDILSVQAYERGLIDKSLSRPTVVEQVRKHLLNPGTTLPRKCDKDVQTQIHDWLFGSEMAMFPERWTPETSEALDTAFDEYYATGKLCDMDIESVLSDEAWIDFFASLQEEP